jgi:hypothetical protein
MAREGFGSLGHSPLFEVAMNAPPNDVDVFAKTGAQKKTSAKKRMFLKSKDWKPLMFT